MEDFEQKNEPKCVQEMWALDKSSFRKRVLHTFAQTIEFGYAEAGDLKRLSKDRQDKLIQSIKDNGFTPPETDEEFIEFAHAIMGRAVTLT